VPAAGDLPRRETLFSPAPRSPGCTRHWRQPPIATSPWSPAPVTSARSASPASHRLRLTSPRSGRSACPPLIRWYSPRAAPAWPPATRPAPTAARPPGACPTATPERRSRPPVADSATCSPSPATRPAYPAHPGRARRRRRQRPHRHGPGHQRRPRQDLHPQQRRHQRQHPVLGRNHRLANQYACGPELASARTGRALRSHSQRQAAEPARHRPRIVEGTLIRGCRDPGPAPHAGGPRRDGARAGRKSHSQR
jgi:hypothetical protein